MGAQGRLTTGGGTELIQIIPAAVPLAIVRKNRDAEGEEEIMREILPQSAEELRQLAAWYREYAERAENPAIWNSRLRTAEHFDEEAARIETELTGARRRIA